jgi:peroxin-2
VFVITHLCERRLNRLASDRTWAERDEDDVYKTLWKVLNYLEVAWKALTLLNFVAFLYNGKYARYLHRPTTFLIVFFSDCFWVCVVSGT